MCISSNLETHLYVDKPMFYSIDGYTVDVYYFRAILMEIMQLL